MLDLKIDTLRIEIADAQGQEHRLGDIASRAAALFGERLTHRYGAASAAATREPAVSAPVSMDLSRTSNEQAASQIAEAWLDAIAVRMKL